MDYTHVQKNSGHSPRKLRLVADMIRKMRPVEAVEKLRFVNRAAAIDLAKVIKAALANAGQGDDLIFKKLEINEGLKMKRFRAGTAGRGRVRPYKRKTSHIKVVLMKEEERGGKQEARGKGRAEKVKAVEGLSNEKGDK